MAERRVREVQASAVGIASLGGGGEFSIARAQRLVSWADVEDVLADAAGPAWPGPVAYVRAYWDGVEVGVCEGGESEARGWLRQRLGPAWLDAESAIRLVPADAERRLPVFFEVTEEEPPSARLAPRFALPATLWHPPTAGSEPPEPFAEPDAPDIVVFHSFKGGVGRTVHAVARALAAAADGVPVLLVDADMEAPGITWMLRERFPEKQTSLADLLVLAHSEPAPRAPSAVQLVADGVKGMLEDGVFFLPAFRTPRQFLAPAVRPEHLASDPDAPYRLTRLLVDLGQAVGARLVVVDLRAGFSELAAGLLLDPRLHRVLVTTLSDQSLQGTCETLRMLSRRAPARRDSDPGVTCVVAQVPLDEPQGAAQAAASRLQSAARDLGSLSSEDDASTEAALVIEVTGFSRDLQVLPATYAEVAERLRRDKAIIERMGEVGPTQSRPEAGTTPTNRTEQRRRLAEAARALVVAETSSATDFLTTEPLARLASDHVSQLPVEIVVGAKGSGKTFTFLQLVRSRTWGHFVSRTTSRVADEPVSSALVCPVLQPTSLMGPALTHMDDARRVVSEVLGVGAPGGAAAVRERLQARLAQSATAPEWRGYWLSAMAGACGLEPSDGEDLPRLLAEAGVRLVVLIDGLEELIPSPGEANSRPALEGLLRNVPLWLEERGDRHLGLVVFARRDYVRASLQQNVEQFERRYGPYSLSWGREEVLRLAAWVARQADLPLKEHGVRQQDWESLRSDLAPLWGLKLGKPDSKQARTADWVVAALSGFGGQVQARDLVRLIAEAAEVSGREPGPWVDRVLTPPAVRTSLDKCGEEKIREIRQEDPALGALLKEIESLGDAGSTVPFSLEDLQRVLPPDGIEALRSAGVLEESGGEYRLPEILRRGMGIRRSDRGVASVLGRSR